MQWTNRSHNSKFSYDNWQRIIFGLHRFDIVNHTRIHYINGESALGNCSGLTLISIPNSVTSIGSLAFEGCNNLETLRIEDGEAELSLYSYDNYGDYPYNYPFKNLKIKNLYVGRDLSNRKALCNSSALHEVSIGNCVTTIGAGAFSGCTGLKSVSLLDGGKPLGCDADLFKDSPLEYVQIGRNIPGSLFREKDTLETAWVSDIVTEIPEYLFYHCSALKNLYIGDGVTKISDWAFSGCYNLSLFNFGKNIVEIGDNALSDCSGMVNIYAEPMTPPTVFEQGLDDINKWECTLHYPEGAPYDTAPQWKEFIFADNNFAVPMAQEALYEESGSVVKVSAFVDSSISDQGVVWRSSNPEIAEILFDETKTSTSQSTMHRASMKEISVNVLIHKAEQVTIAAFLPTGEMANCIINKGNIGTSIQEIESEDFGNSESGYVAFNMQGVWVMRSVDAEALL